MATGRENMTTTWEPKADTENPWIFPDRLDNELYGHLVDVVDEPYKNGRQGTFPKIILSIGGVERYTSGLGAAVSKMRTKYGKPEEWKGKNVRVFEKNNRVHIEPVEEDLQ